MKEPGPKYLKILKIELEDLVEDINVLLSVCDQRKQSGEITNYVFLENATVLKNEISGINNFLHGVDGIDISQYKNLKDLIEDIDVMFKQRTKDYDFPEAVYAIVKRKLNKVSRYIFTEEKQL